MATDALLDAADTAPVARRLRRAERARDVDNALQARPSSAVLPTLVDAAALHGAQLAAARLDAVRRFVEQDLHHVEAALAAAASSRGDLGQRAAAHLLERPGKRVRPMSVLLSARLGQGPPADDRFAIAAAAELTHAATLLHDDVIDAASSRRGAPAARVVYGNTASVLGGDHLLVDALRRVRATGRNDLLDGLLEAIGEMIAAEALQLRAQQRFCPDPDVYHAVISGKTAALFRWAMGAGGALAGLDSDAVAALRRVGTALGFAFQLVDDALDLAVEADTGKDLAADLREGKLTWPLIVACEANRGLTARIIEAAADPAVLADAQRREDLLQALRATGCVAATRERARAFARAAQRELATLPPTHARHALELVVGAVVSRHT